MHPTPPAHPLHLAPLLDRAGRLDKGPRRPQAKREHADAQELTKAINGRNEEKFAGVAASTGGRLGVIKAPIVSTADERQRSRMGKRPGVPWGASSKQ